MTDGVTMREYVDQANAATARNIADTRKMGLVALAGVVACGWTAFWLNAKAIVIAQESIRQATDSKAESLAESLKFHNGKIRQSEIERAEERATLATKEEIAPLVDDWKGRQASAVTVSKLLRWVVIALGLGMSFGFGIANLPGVMH